MIQVKKVESKPMQAILQFLSCSDFEIIIFDEPTIFHKSFEVNRMRFNGMIYGTFSSGLANSGLLDKLVFGRFSSRVSDIIRDSA